MACALVGAVDEVVVSLGRRAERCRAERPRVWESPDLWPWISVVERRWEGSSGPTAVMTYRRTVPFMYQSISGGAAKPLLSQGSCQVVNSTIGQSTHSSGIQRLR